jgi:type IV secretion system protein VirB6
VFQLVLSLVGDQWGQINGQDPMAGGLLFIALSILGAIFFLQTPSIAAGIAGGASAGLADFGGAVGMAFRGGSRFSNALTQGGQGRATRTGGSLRPLGGRV